MAQAYELRGRAHLSLGDPERAERDFELVLQARAGYTLAADLSPVELNLFDEARRRVVGTLLLSMPQPGVVTIDGQDYAVDGDAVIDLVAGQHAFTIRQPGFREE